MKRTYTITLTLIAAIALIVLWTQMAISYPQYSQQTGKPCGYCHVNPQGTKDLTAAGQYFKQHNTLEGYTEAAPTEPTTPAQPTTPTEPTTPPTQPTTPPAEQPVTPPAEQPTTPPAPTQPGVEQPAETPPTPPAETQPGAGEEVPPVPPAPEIEQPVPPPTPETPSIEETRPGVPAGAGGAGGTTQIEMAPQAGYPALPATGTDAGGMLALGAGLISAGAWMWRKKS